MLNEAQSERLIRLAKRGLPEDGVSRGILVIVVETGKSPSDIDVTGDGICPEDIPRLLLDTFEYAVKGSSVVDFGVSRPVNGEEKR